MLDTKIKPSLEDLLIVLSFGMVPENVFDINFDTFYPFEILLFKKHNQKYRKSIYNSLKRNKKSQMMLKQSNIYSFNLAVGLFLKPNL